MKSDWLWQLTVHCGAEAEEPVFALVERELRQSPIIFIDEKTRRCHVSAFAGSELKSSRRWRERIAAGLVRLRQQGILVRPASVTLKKLPRDGWAESWKKHFRPLQIGSDLLVKPTWSKRRPLVGQAVVKLDPGLAFGTGQHPTTSFCLRQLVLERGEGENQSFLDVGTGSGILAIAAVKLGYHPVTAFDNDPTSVKVARENLVLNGVSKLVDLELKDLKRLPVRSATKYHLVCANVIFDVLVVERRKIAALVAGNGRLVLAGILRSQFSALRTAYHEVGMKLIRQRTEKEWAAGTFAFVAARRAGARRLRRCG